MLSVTEIQLDLFSNILLEQFTTWHF